MAFSAPVVMTIIAIKVIEDERWMCLNFYTLSDHVCLVQNFIAIDAIYSRLMSIATLTMMQVLWVLLVSMSPISHVSSSLG